MILATITSPLSSRSRNQSCSKKSVRGIFGVARVFLMPKTGQNCTPHTFVVSQDFGFLPLKQRYITTSKKNLTKDREIRPVEC